MSSFTDQLRERAAQCRKWAKASHHRVEQGRLLAMAEQYDGLAIKIESLDEQKQSEKPASRIGTGRFLFSRRSSGEPAQTRN